MIFFFLSADSETYLSFCSKVHPIMLWFSQAWKTDITEVPHHSEPTCLLPKKAIHMFYPLTQNQSVCYQSKQSMCSIPQNQSVYDQSKQSMCSTLSPKTNLFVTTVNNPCLLSYPPKPVCCYQSKQSMCSTPSPKTNLFVTKVSNACALLPLNQSVCYQSKQSMCSTPSPNTSLFVTKSSNPPPPKKKKKKTCLLPK